MNTHKGKKHVSVSTRYEKPEETETFSAISSQEELLSATDPLSKNTLPMQQETPGKGVCPSLT